MESDLTAIQLLNMGKSYGGVSEPFSNVLHAPLPRKKRRRGKKRKNDGNETSTEGREKETIGEPEFKELKGEENCTNGTNVNGTPNIHVSGLKETDNIVSSDSRADTVVKCRKKRNKKKKGKGGESSNSNEMNNGADSISPSLYVKRDESQEKGDSRENDSNPVTVEVKNVILNADEAGIPLPRKKKKKRKRKKGVNDVSSQENEKEIGDEPVSKRAKVEAKSSEGATVSSTQDPRVSSLIETNNPFSISREDTLVKSKKKKRRKRKGKCAENRESKQNGSGVDPFPLPEDVQRKERQISLMDRETQKQQHSSNPMSGEVKKDSGMVLEGHPSKKRKNGIDEENTREFSGKCDVKRIRVDSNSHQPSVSSNTVRSLNSGEKEISCPLPISIENLSASTGSKRKRKKKNQKKNNDFRVKEVVSQEVNDKNLMCSLNEKTSEVENIDNVVNKLENALNQRETAALTKKKRRNKKKKKNKQHIDSVAGSSVNEGILAEKLSSLDETTSSSSAELNAFYAEAAVKKEITKSWEKCSLLQKDNGFELLGKPFRCSYMPDFLQDSDFLEKVKEELSHIDIIEKNNDLYKFSQTSDLKAVSSPHITSLRKFLYGDFRSWLSDVTGIILNDTIDMGSSRYKYTDVLLCHDDELEGRRVAYILYLTPPWKEEDGGTLDLFDVDNNGQPQDIVKSLRPKWNTFAFFEVSPVSFHQVQEVLSKDKTRLSINGWFHGSNIERPPKYIEPAKPLFPAIHIEEDELYAWMNPSYLDMDTQKSIRKTFQDNSEIELEKFLCDERYEELVTALQSNNLQWTKVGPANKQMCKVLKQEEVPEIIRSCYKFLQSEALFLILSQLTGLKLHHLAPPDSDSESDEEENLDKKSCPGVSIDIREWSHGCYTLLRDGDSANRSCSLDATLFLKVREKWTLEHGGFTSYIAKDEDEELLTVLPRSNCLALVYRDAESLGFTKYVNASVNDMGKQDSVFFDINCTYKE